MQLIILWQKPQQPGNSEVGRLHVQATALNLPNTGMATAMTLMKQMIFILKQKDVDERLALAAIKNLFTIITALYTSPVYDKMDIKKTTSLFLSKKHRNLLKNKYGYVYGFAIAGGDHVFIGHMLCKQQQSSCLQSRCSSPVAVRYAWADNPGALNLYSNKGFTRWRLSNR